VLFSGIVRGMIMQVVAPKAGELLERNTNGTSKGVVCHSCCALQHGTLSLDEARDSVQRCRLGYEGITVVPGDPTKTSWFRHGCWSMRDILSCSVARGFPGGNV
jgi:hypothetical protein